MQIEPILKRITIYPVKSLDGVSLQKAMITEGGCLLHDREYAIMDGKGNLVTGKSNPLVHALRSTIDFETETISFRKQDGSLWSSFHLQDEKKGIELYLSDYFGKPVYFLKESTGRFLDIPDTSGATLISESSLKTVSGWYNLNMEESRKRFRATLEIEGVPAFWEDRLFSADGAPVEFKIGDVTLRGMSPRERCVVPTRNPDTGEVIHAFPKTFARLRAASVPEWSELNEFGHYYYLSVDCSIPASEIRKWIETGVKVTIV